MTNPCYEKFEKKWPVKAYKSLEFLNSPAARPVRILSEFIEPGERYKKHKIKNTVVVFGSARIKPRAKALARLKEVEKVLVKMRTVSPKAKAELKSAKVDLCASKYYEDARELSKRITLWFKQIEKKGIHFAVCTGGGPGIMEAANRGAYEAKGMSIGMNISLPMEQHPNPYQTKEVSSEFHYFFIRKFWFTYLAKALIVFPGGYGTLDELFEVLTLVQTKKIDKKMTVVLYGKEFWNKLINFEVMEEWGTVLKEELKLFKIVDTVDEAYDHLKNEIMYLVKEKEKYKKYWR
ncbi:MAG: TIGR00730 family Rossman fold protein [Candidatus Omnitrophica bacterium]|nr:TIGR00730 family Rossman fold protein [Candidatus Omnitrophota bacterium]